jgi:hypothetical protein
MFWGGLPKPLQIYARFPKSYSPQQGSEEKGFALGGTGHDDSVQRLVGGFGEGYLTLREFLAKAGALGLTAGTATGLIGATFS